MKNLLREPMVWFVAAVFVVFITVGNVAMGSWGGALPPSA